jgi:hypothetical protein
LIGYIWIASNPGINDTIAKMRKRSMYLKIVEIACNPPIWGRITEERSRVILRLNPKRKVPSPAVLLMNPTL